MTPATSTRDPQGLPDPGPDCSRRAPAGLPGQREHLAEAAPGARRADRATTSGTTPTCTAARTRSARRPPRRTRARGQGRRVHRRAPTETRSSSPRTPTEAINLVAYAFGNASAGGSGPDRFRLGPGDEIVITEMEHHSNIVPWQLLCERTGATLRWFGITDDGRLDLSDLDELINERTKVVSLVHLSNILGTVNPVRRDRRAAHAVGALVLLDASQSVPHMPVDVAALGVDFLRSPGTRCAARPASACCGAAASCSTAMPPFLGGGEMIETVSDGAVDVRAAAAQVRGRHPADRRRRSGSARPSTTSPRSAWTRSHAHEQRLLGYALDALAAIDGLRIIGPADAGRPGRRDLVRASTASTRTTSARCSTSTASRSGSATTAPGRCAARSASRRPRGRRSTSTTTPDEIDALVEGIARRSGSSR